MQQSAPQQGSYRNGDVVADRYVLVRELGEGGMGVVWIAHSRALDVDVALKMLRSEPADSDAVERMAREARTAAQLGHPALVRVLDFGTSERGEPFLAMELLQGDELQALLEREGRLLPERAVALLLPLIDGLGTAHDKGIVHRDIKPENVFIARDDQGRLQPKMLDFGIAKLTTGAPVSRLTESGAIVGSPQYFSPQQAEGLEDVDFRTDIWSMGVLLYELVTGVPPFAGANYNALIYSISQKEPVPTTEHGVGDEQLWGIVSRCLQKDPADRWGSMWELGEALALWLFERGVRVDAASRSLKDGWLEGALTGVQVLVESEPAAALSVRTPVKTPSPVRRRVPNAGLVTTIKRAPARATRKRVSLAVLAVAVLAVALFVGLRRHEQDPPVAAGTAAVPHQPSVAGVLATSASALPAPSAAAAASAEAPPVAPSAKPPGAPAPDASGAARPRNDASRRKATPPAAVKRPPLHGAVDTEFGF